MLSIICICCCTFEFFNSIQIRTSSQGSLLIFRRNFWWLTKLYWSFCARLFWNTYSNFISLIYFSRYIFILPMNSYIYIICRQLISERRSLKTLLTFCFMICFHFFFLLFKLIHFLFVFRWYYRKLLLKFNSF